MSAPELEPCPFCGPMNGHYGFTIGRFGTRLTCFCCDSHGPRAETREEAISSWNTRSALPISDALALPEVQALVDASKGLLFAHDHGNGLEGWHNTRERMRAALRAIEGGET